jgi:hypothetical protein
VVSIAAGDDVDRGALLRPASAEEFDVWILTCAMKLGPTLSR